MKMRTVKKFLMIINIVCACIVFFYAFRRVNFGLDLADTGYNIGNYKYMSLKHIDAPWFFATLLSNAIGHVICLLPLGDRLIGFNIYSALLIAAMTVLIGLFLKKEMKLPGLLVWFGEFLALSLYWLPTSVLYDSLSFLFRDIAVILLYIGLTHKRKICLLGAGGYLALIY